MQSLTCCGVQPGLQVVSVLRRSAGRLAARRTAWYSGSPAVTPPGSPWRRRCTVPSSAPACRRGRSRSAPSRRSTAARSCRPRPGRASAFSLRAAPRRFRSSPERWISGWATPSWSTRLRMMSIARSSDSVSTFDCAVGLRLVDELDAALQVQPEARLLGCDRSPPTRRAGRRRSAGSRCCGGGRSSSHETTCRGSARATARRRRHRRGTCPLWRSPPRRVRR